MRKFSLLFALLLIYNFSISQTIVDSTQEWNTFLISEQGFQVGHELIRFGNDTTVNTNVYKKVLRLISEPQSSWSSYGLIRETTDKKIYYRTDTSNQEYLLYNFSLNLHDTVISTVISSYNSGAVTYLQSAPLVVQSIDSILVGTKFRKQLHMFSFYAGIETDQWVEGMGSLSGMLHSNFGFVGGDTYKLLCFLQNDSLFYLNPSYDLCYFLTSVFQEDSRRVSISINPNPVTGVSIVSIKNINKNESTRLKIYNCTGELIQSLQVRDGMEINGKNFISGLFLFRFTDDSGTVETVNVIIK